MHNNNEIRKRNSKFVVAGVITAVMLIGTTAISTLTTAESVFAYRNNQAASQANDCGNGSVPIDTVLCQNTGSQIQGDKNTVALTAEQTFPEPPPQTCVECFTTFLTAEQIEQLLSVHVTNTIEEFCQFAESIPDQPGFLDATATVLAEQGVGDLNIEQLIDCLERALGLTP
jgi:hypothetical protein